MSINGRVTANAIETEKLTLRYGQLTAVDGLNLCVPAGSVYGFLGLNGAGKTSTIRMLLGLIRPNAGEVRLFGKHFDARERALLSQVGSLVESPSLYLHLTGYENLELTRRLVGGRPALVQRALMLAGLEQVAKRLVRTYSMGMRQRLGLALALLNNPQLLILDEPTNGLDPAGIREMRALIERMSAEQGVTVFLSSHLLSEIEQVATHIGIIHKGKLMFQSTPDELHARLQEFVSIEVEWPDEGKRILTDRGWSVQSVNDHQLIVPTQKRTDAAAINAQLVNAGLSVYRLGVQQPSLEDIFLKLTGETEEEAELKESMPL